MANDATAEKKALLNQLKIDRNAPRNRSMPAYLWLGLIALVVGGLAGYWLLFPNAAAAPVSVSTVLVQNAPGQAAGASVLDATGYVVARRQATVSSKATGKVVEVLIEEGVMVQAGQLLASLDDSIPRRQFELAQSQLQSSRASLAELDVMLQQARLDLSRTEGLAQRNLASQADLDRDGLSVQALMARLERARRDIDVAERVMAVQQQVLDDMQIRAPFAGVVIAKAAQPGEMISPVSAGGGFTRTGICTIVDMNSLEVEVDVNESYINRVQAGQPVRVTLNAYPDHQFPAEVIAIIPAADRNKATVRVRVKMLERDERVLPDMGVRVAFLDEQTQAEPAAALQGVFIPQAGLGNDADGNFVYLVRGEQVHKRKVRIGESRQQGVQVLTGLATGDRIVAPLNPALLQQLQDGAPIAMSN